MKIIGTKHLQTGEGELEGETQRFKIANIEKSLIPTQKARCLLMKKKYLPRHEREKRKKEYQKADPRLPNCKSTISTLKRKEGARSW